MIWCHLRQTSAAEHKDSDDKYGAASAHGSWLIAVSYDGSRSSMVAMIKGEVINHLSDDRKNV
jgi:hypothetical protein